MPRNPKSVVDVAVIVADSSPIMTLNRIGRLDVLGLFNIPIHIVDQVFWEVTKPENDPTGAIAAGLHRLGNQINIIETFVGLGFQTKRARDPSTPSGNLGELAVNEYAMTLSNTSGPRFVPLVFYEDPDVERLPVASLNRAHMLNTTAYLIALADAKILPEGRTLVDRINALRKTPMIPIDQPARRRKFRTTWIRKVGTMNWKSQRSH